MERQIIVKEQTYVVKDRECVTVQFPVDLTEMEIRENSFTLQLRGQTGIHPSLMYEGGLPYLYRDIDDALSEETHHSRFSLMLSDRNGADGSGGTDYPRRAYYLIQCPPWINSQYPVPESDDTCWKFRGLVKTEKFRKKQEEHNEKHDAHGKSSYEACAEVRFDIWMKKEGRDPRDISGTPDASVRVPLPEGTCGWTEISGTVQIGKNTAAVLVSIRTEHTEGTVWLEDFTLTNSTGFNILPPFDLTNKYHPFMNWLGENLSQKEWTLMKAAVNGYDLGRQALFQRCFAGAENEIPLPPGILKPGMNELTLENVSDYLCPAPYILTRLALHVKPERPVQIIYCPEYVPAHSEFGILVKTAGKEMEVSLTVPPGLNAEKNYLFHKPGLHVIRIAAGACESRLRLSVSAAGYEEQAEIRRIVEKDPDGIVTGSGDAVYIPQEMRQMEDFVCWFLSGHLGDMITFRPVYRWSGSRTCRPEVWRRMAELLNGLNISYCYISDGRELPGINANPTDEMLAGRYYLGSQGHERDGAFYYWLQTARQVNETLYEAVSRMICSHPDYTYRTPFEYGTKDLYYNFSPEKCRTMEDGARQFVEKASVSLRGIRRHTGPSTLFKYLYQAGVEVCGAELMYGPHEVVLSALRGASIAYGRDTYTAHLAVQWGTTPHDSEAHFRRFRLSLFLSYIHGCRHINTEEGFYRMEEMFTQSDRFSRACTGHADVQREFVRFVNTHSRRGKMVSPVAILHGANDAWVCFTRRNAWSQEGEEWQFDTPEESWDLIKVFYPDSLLDAIYRHPCPDEPQGYYSRTPYGTVDILPVEASAEIYGRYRHMAFLGYNTADEEQVEKLCGYVEKGGKLLLGWCHLFTDTDRQAAIRGVPHPVDAEKLTGVKLNGFLPQQDGVSAGDITVTGGDVTVVKEKDGRPLVIRRRLGKGEIWLVNAREYPASCRVRDTYEDILRLFGEEAVTENMEKGWLNGNDTVGSAVYDREDGTRVIYAVNTNWWGGRERTAKAGLYLAGRHYMIDIPGDRITQITIKGDLAAVTSDMETEILDIRREDDGYAAVVQGEADSHVEVFGENTGNLQKRMLY